MRLSTNERTRIMQNIILTEFQREHLISWILNNLTDHSDDLKLRQRESYVASWRIIGWLECLPIEDAEYFIDCGWQRVMDEFDNEVLAN